jgi:hypothetical protein
VVGSVLAVVFGFWFWYAWFGSVPHPMASVKFDDRAYAGESYLTEKDQWVYLHGGTMARYDLKAGKQVWSFDIINKKEMADLIAKKEQEINDEREKKHALGFSMDELPRLPAHDEFVESMQRGAEASLHLIVHGENVWVAKEDKIRQYDWATGQPGKEFPIPAYRRPTMRGEELLYMDQNELGQQVITHFNLASGESHPEIIGEPTRAVVAAAAPAKKPVAVASARGTASKSGGAGLPLGIPGANSDKPLDPAKVAAQAQRLPYAQKVALPATLANAMHQEKILAELNDEDRKKMLTELAKLGGREADSFAFIPSENGYLQWTSRVLEERSQVYNAMKPPPPPGKSALDNNPGMANTAEVANEILNEMQRSRGGDVEVEDISRYEVVVRKPDAKEVPDWKGEIIGPPALISLKTVNVVVGGRMVVVLDKSNKKLWQADFSQRLRAGSSRFDEDNDERDGVPDWHGDGPCVEHGDALYVFDAATLTAFDLTAGTVRWRVPSVGIAGLFFDGEGMLYANTEGGNLDTVKFSRQIDITKSASSSVLKIDPKSGKVLWNVQPGGYVSHVEGKFIFCFAMNVNDTDPDDPYALPGQMGSLMDIRRLNPKNGKVMWDYVQQRAPLHVRFSGNRIEIVFRKEVQVLKFLSL